MNLTTVKAFRHEVYGCFGQAIDTLFNLVDALLTEDRAKSFPELSLSPHVERRWPSVYEGLEDDQIDQRYLREVFARFLLGIERDKSAGATGLTLPHSNGIVEGKINK